MPVNTRDLPSTAPDSPVGSRFVSVVAPVPRRSTTWPRGGFVAKRVMDLSIAILVGTLLLPLLIVVAAAIRISSPGPVLYSAYRIGRGGSRFRAWKFRTMVQGADRQLEAYLDTRPELREEWQRSHKLQHDPRIIRGIGHFLRKSSLDELPQIWNVLRGDMSLIGPRPIVAEEIGKYGDAFHLYCQVPPGISGLWQVSGRNHTTYARRIELDSQYVRNWSPWLDVYIMVRTVKAVLLCEGAY